MPTVLNFNRIKETVLPEWTKPENASVFDPAYRAPIRTIIKWLGLDDPQQVMAFGTPLEAGPMAGGALEAIGKRFPRFAEALKSYTHPGQQPFYSRLEEAVQGLPKQVPVPKLLGVVQKGQASAEELAARGVPEFAAQYGTKPIPREAIAAHLEASPVQLQVKTLGGQRQDISRDLEDLARGHLGRMPNSPDDWERVSRMLEGEAQGFQRRYNDELANRYFGLSEEATRASEGLNLSTGSTAGQPKYAQYQLPGGTNYRETLITLPETESKRISALRDELEDLTAQPSRVTTWKGEDRTAAFDRLMAEFKAAGGTPFRPTGFKSSHFDEPNILVHTRSNERDLHGLGKGTFLEEVQSDWHQQGKAKGYGPQGVPDAPFKETWPDLALKHHLVEAAQNPETNWLGFTSGETQAARYDLSKHIDSMKIIKGNYEGVGEGYQIDAWKDGRHVIDGRRVSENELPGTIGKELAQKAVDDLRVAQSRSVPKYSVDYKGLDLSVGGEGMKYFYDTLLPKRLEKIVKPFGAAIERGGPENGWIIRLTPEVKRRILTEGVPLMTGVAAVGSAQSREK